SMVFLYMAPMATMRGGGTRSASNEKRGPAAQGDCRSPPPALRQLAIFLRAPPHAQLLVERRDDERRVGNAARDDEVLRMPLHRGLQAVDGLAAGIEVVLDQVLRDPAVDERQVDAPRHQLAQVLQVLHHR